MPKADAPTPWRVSLTDETTILDADRGFVASTFTVPDYRDHAEHCAALAERIARLPALEAALRKIADAPYLSVLLHEEARQAARKALGNV